MSERRVWATLPPEDVFTKEFQQVHGLRCVTHAEDFMGAWDDKYWKNTPGPFYSTTDNMMSLLASGEAPSHLLYDDHCEFVWRQPLNEVEYARCIGAMNCDEVSSYGADGNRHWTPQLVGEWWQRRHELLAWAREHLLRPRDNPADFWYGCTDATDRQLLTEYIRFLQQHAEDYLRSYVFLLLEGRPARDRDHLPSLET